MGALRFSSPFTTCTLISSRFSLLEWPIELGVDSLLSASGGRSGSNSFITIFLRFFRRRIWRGEGRESLFHSPWFLRVYNSVLEYSATSNI